MSRHLHLFPFIETNPKMVYLDSASTSLRHFAVSAAVDEFSCKYNINLGRTFGHRAVEFGNRIDGIRDTIKEMYNCKNFYFTSSATESLNDIAKLLLKNGYINNNSKIVLGIDNHHANILPFEAISKNIKYILLNKDYNLNFDQLLKLDYIPDLIALTLSSNVLGGYLDLDQLRTVRKLYPKAILVLDGTQYLASKSIDFDSIEADFVVGTFHKMYGPSGLGFTIYKDQYLDLIPSKVGGGNIADVTIDGPKYLAGGLQYEAGTLNLDTILSLESILDFLKNHVYNHEFIDISFFDRLDNFTLYRAVNADKTFCIKHNTMSSFDLANLLSIHGYIVRVGSHCCNPLIHYLKEEGLIRISLGVYNTNYELNNLFYLLKKL